MVTDKIENILFYKPMTPALEVGTVAVKTIEELEPGRCRFDGGYFNIQKGETKPMNEGTSETHHRYIDMQILIKGCGEVVWADVGDLKIVIPYDREKDAERLSGDIKNRIRAGQGMFYIALPHNRYKSVSRTDEPRSFTKVITKIPIPERVQAYPGG